MATKLGVTVSLNGSGNVNKVFDDAAKSAQRLQAEAAQVKAGWAAAITAISTSFLALQAIMGPIIQALSKPVEMALDAERAMLKLGQALRVTGRDGEDAQAQLGAYAERLEKSTGNAAELTESLMAQNIIFGMNARQAEITTEATSKLAVVTGDMASANEMLIAATNNQIRALVKIVPEVAKLTEAQLRHGDAITLVNSKLDGLTRLTVSNASTAIMLARALWDDFTKALGASILGGVNWAAAFERVKTTIATMSDALSANSDEFGKLGNWFVNTGLDVFDKAAYVFEQWAPDVNILTYAMQKLYSITSLFVVSAVGLVAVFEYLLAGVRGNDEQLERMRKTIEALEKSYDGAVDGITGFRTGLEETGKAVDDLRAKAKDPIEIEFSKPFVDLSVFDQWKASVSDMTKGMADEQNKANDQMLANVNQWGALWTKFKSLFDSGNKNAANTFGPPKSAMPPEVKPGAPVADLRRADDEKLSGSSFSDTALTQDPELLNKQRDMLNQIVALDKTGYSSIAKNRQVALAAIKKMEDDAHKIGIDDAKAFAAARSFVENDAMQKRQDAVDKVAQIERDGYSQIERDRDVALSSIRRAEQDANKDGIADAKVFAAARVKIMKDAARAEVDVQRQITIMTGNEYEVRRANDSKAWDELNDLQAKQGVKSFEDLKKQADARVRLLVNQYHDQLTAEQQSQIEIAQMLGQNYKVQELLYQAHQDKLTQMGKGANSGKQAELEQASKDLGDQYNKESGAGFYNGYRKAKTAISNIGSEEGQGDQVQPLSPDEIEKFNGMADTARGVITDAQNGLSSVISSIGSLYGPPGQLIASFVNMLNQTPAAFQQMVDGLMDGIINLIPNIMANIPILIDRILIAIPDIIASIVGTLLSIPMWVKFLTAIVHGIGDLLQGIFTQAVFGRSLRDKTKEAAAEAAQTATTAKQEPAQFGANNPNEGDGKFKIKDVQQGQTAKPAEEIQDTFPKVVEEASKNFVDYLIDGWHDFWDGVVEGLTEFWDALVGSVLDPLAFVRKIGALLSDIWKDWNPFSGVDASSMIDGRAIVEKISDAFEKAFPGMAENVKNAIKDAWDGVVTAFKDFMANPAQGLKDIAQSFGDFLRDPMQVLSDIVNKMGAFLTDHFPFLGDLVDKMKAFAADPFGSLMDAADKLHDFILDKLPFLKPIADKIGEFSQSTHATLEKLADKLLAFTEAKLPFLAPVAKALSDFVHDPMQFMKDAAVSARDTIMEAVNGFGDIATKAGDYFWTRMDDVIAFFKPAMTDAADYFANLGGQVSQGFKDAVAFASDGLGATIRQGWTDFEAAVGRAAGAFGLAVAQAWQSFEAGVSGAAAAFGASVTGAWTDFKTGVDSAGTGFGTAVTGAWTDFKTGVSSAATDFGTSIASTFDGVKTSLAGAATDFGDSAAKTGTSIRDKIVDGGASLWTNFTTSANAWWTHWADAGSNIWTGLTTKASAGIADVKKWGANLWQGALDALAAAPQYLKSAGGQMFAGLSDSITANFDWLKNIGVKAWNGLSDMITLNFDWLGGIGTRIWNGFVNGVVGVWDWIKGIGGRIWDGIKGGLDSIGGKAKSALGLERGGEITSRDVDKSGAALFSALGAQHFAMGGEVQDDGGSISDTVPAVLAQGERVLNRQENRALNAGGGTTEVNLTITFNVASGANVDKEAVKKMGDQVIDYIRRESKNGRNILRPTGVY